MAESLDDIRTKNREELETKDVVDSSSKESAPIDDGGIPECAVCLQTCVHPCRLPCGHIFCFLCIKGTVATTHPGSVRRCAMCRREIPLDFLEKPNLLRPIFPTPVIAPNSGANGVRGASVNTNTNPDLIAASLSDDHEGYQWFYEGRNGWWQYDERTSLELEAAYKRGERSCELLIAGFLYIADFDGMVQLRRGDPSRRRRIKRDLASIPVKGVAGLRQRVPAPIEEDQDASVDLSCYFQQDGNEERSAGGSLHNSGRFRNQHHLIQIPPTPANTPGNTSPGVPPSSTNISTIVGNSYPDTSLRHVVEEMGRLRLGETRACLRHSTSESSREDGQPQDLGGVGEEDGEEVADDQEVNAVNVRTSSVLWSPVSPDIASASPWVLTLSSDEDQL